MARAEIRARATLDNKGFRTGLAQMNQGVNRFASGQIRQMGSMIGGAFAVGAVVNFTKELFNTADAINNTSKQLGIGVEELQALQRETELTTGSAEKMRAALIRLVTAQARATGGMTEQVEAFKDLGISMKQVQSLDPAKLFEIISAKVSNADAASREASAASKILGESYAELNVVMDKVANIGLENLKNQMLETNQIMSSDSVAAADAMEEQFNRATTSMTNTLREFAVVAFGIIDEIAARAGRLSNELNSGNAIKKSVEFFTKTPAQAIAELAGGLFGGGKVAEMATSEEQKAALAKLMGEAEKPDESFLQSVLGGNAVKTGAIPKAQAADSLARIGGILGSQTQQADMDRVARETLAVNRIAKDAALKTAAALDHIKRNTEVLQEG